MSTRLPRALLRENLNCNVYAALCCRLNAPVQPRTLPVNAAASLYVSGADMFAWKRRRREGTAESRDLSPLPCSASPMDVPSVGLTSGGSEPCGRLPSLGGVHLATPPCSSDITALLCSQHSSEPCSSSPHTSIELAAAPSPAPHPGSVRSKAAYFEALCRSNTTVHIQVGCMC